MNLVADPFDLLQRVLKAFAGVLGLPDGLLDDGVNLVHGIQGRIRAVLEVPYDLVHLPRRTIGLFGKLPNLVRNDREPPARISGPRGFDRRVERQKIRLVRYGRDAFHEGGDGFDRIPHLLHHSDRPGRVFAEIPYGVNHLPNLRPGLLAAARGFRGRFRALRRSARGSRRRNHDFVNPGAALLQGGRIVRGKVRKSFHLPFDPLHGGSRPLGQDRKRPGLLSGLHGAGPRLLDRAPLRFDHSAERVREDFRLVSAPERDPPDRGGQISALHATDEVNQQLQRPGDPPREQKRSREKEKKQQPHDKRKKPYEPARRIQDADQALSREIGSDHLARRGEHRLVRRKEGNPQDVGPSPKLFLLLQDPVGDGRGELRSRRAPAVADDGRRVPNVASEKRDFRAEEAFHPIHEFVF